jgi:hypothetical protein
MPHRQQNIIDKLQPTQSEHRTSSKIAATSSAAVTPPGTTSPVDFRR